jgi:hypothetical protein
MNENVAENAFLQFLRKKDIRTPYHTPEINVFSNMEAVQKNDSFILRLLLISVKKKVNKGKGKARIELEKFFDDFQDEQSNCLIIDGFRVNLCTDATIELLIEWKHRKKNVLVSDQFLIDKIHSLSSIDLCR